MLVVLASVFGIVSLVLASMAAAVAMTTPLGRLRVKTKFEKPKQKPRYGPDLRNDKVG